MEREGWMIIETGHLFKRKSGERKGFQKLLPASYSLNQMPKTSVSRLLFTNI